MQNMEQILAYIYIRWKKDEKERKKPQNHRIPEILRYL